MLGPARREPPPIDQDDIPTTPGWQLGALATDDDDDDAREQEDGRER